MDIISCEICGKNHPKSAHCTDLCGSLVYTMNSIKDAFTVLVDVNKKLNDSMKDKNNLNPDTLGMLDKILKDYLIIKIYSLFDPEQKSVSLYSLRDFLHKNYPRLDVDFGRKLRVIRKKYSKYLIPIEKHRHGVAAHVSQNAWRESIMHTYDLINSPIIDLVADVNELVVEGVLAKIK